MIIKHANGRRPNLSGWGLFPVLSNPPEESSTSWNPNSRSRFSFSRAGFTLVELLVVVVIIGILAAGTTAVVVRVVESQRRANTNTLLNTINDALQKQASKIADQARKDVDPTTSGDIDTDIKNAISTYWSIIFVDKVANATASNYQALLKSYGISSKNDFDKLSLPSGGVVGGNGKNDPTIDNFEKSFCLYMVLKGKFSALDPDLLGREAVQMAAGPGTKRIPYIADQWGDPITFSPTASGASKSPIATSPNQ